MTAQVEWLPTDKILPAYGVRVLITRIYGRQESTRLVEIAYREKTDSHGEWWNICDHRVEEAIKLSSKNKYDPPGQFRVIAWKDLPEAYDG